MLLTSCETNGSISCVGDGGGGGRPNEPGAVPTAAARCCEMAVTWTHGLVLFPIVTWRRGARWRDAAVDGLHCFKPGLVCSEGDNCAVYKYMYP